MVLFYLEERYMLNLKKNKKTYLILIAIIISVIITFFIVFIKNNYKSKNIGNNISSKTIDEVEDYICNISSYNAIIEVTIQSNKNTNKYVLKQIHLENGEQYEDIQEVIEPENIKGLKLVYKNGTLEIQNTKLGLSKIYNNYPYIENSNLWLNLFLKEYKQAGNDNKEMIEEDGEIKLILAIKDDSKIRYKELFVDKKTGKPTKLLIEDDNKNPIIYILYTEIEINY